ncbi:hypothetical protein M0805_000906 [Coniferiporia weirii]|nr:hypothetical protein M0805_000906 [Coniferiporia weirii]
MSDQNIVILGGGGAGTATARLLSAKLPKGYSLILITTRECYVHMPAAIRMSVTSKDKLEETALIPYDSLFANGNGTVKVGNAVSIESQTNVPGGSVVLEGGESIAFRYLVVATGSNWEGPLKGLSGKKQELHTIFKQWREKFEAAKGIVLAGAGSVALEMSGELRDFSKSKPITIVQATSLPLNDAYPDSFRKDVERRWRGRGIEFVFNDRIDGDPGNDFSSVKTAGGKTIEADTLVFTRGGSPNTSILRSLGEDVLDSRGYVKILPTLQVAGYSDIFAAGDIILFKEQKALAKTPGHADVIATNILSLISGGGQQKSYTGTFEGIFITNGKNKGTGYVDKLWGLKFGDTIVPMVKGKHLFVDLARKNMGVTP